ncbi:uncharacterized protein C15orf39 homolog [Porphyrio hochstetteri]
MASKRHLEPRDPVIFNKLPRLETEPAATFPTSICKSSSLPNPGSENHFNYKGSYFTCPLQSPNGPEHHPLAPWNSAPPYLHYNAGSQPVPVEGSLLGCLLYQPEGMGTRLQPPGPQKGKESLMQELLTAQEKWTSPPAALGHPFPVKKPVAVNKTTPLAVPKPMYRAPVCFMDPRLALPLGPRAESLQHRLGDADWAPPPAGHPLNPGESRGRGTGLHKRGHHSNPDLPPLHPSLALPTKEKLGSPVTFSSCYTAFEKYRGPPGTSFLEAGCPAAHSQRKVPEVPRLSPDPWSKHQPPTTSPAQRERPPPCYPQTHYPLPVHKATLLYHPPAPTAEAQPGTLPSTYKGFGFAESREPFPGSYLQPQAPRSYFPNPVDTYVPRAADAGTVTSPPTKSSAPTRDNAEPPRRAGYLPGPSFAFGPGDAAGSGTSSSSSSAEPGSERHWVESPRQRAVRRHNSAFQPVCTPEKVPGGSSGLPEMLPKGEVCWGKPCQGEQEPPYLRRRVSPAPQESPRGTTRAPIIVGKGDACKTKDVAKDVVPPPPSASSPKGLKDPRDREVSPPSPPMPVINNVFSLAEYCEYLEDTEGLAQAFCREHLRGDTPPQNVSESRDSPAFGDVPAGMAAGQAAKVGSGVVHSQGESCYGKVPEKPKLMPQDLGAQECSLGGVRSGKLAPKDIVLDLSVKKKLGTARETPRPVGCMKGTPDGEDDDEEKEAPGKKGGVGETAKPQALPSLLEVGSGDKNTFQSSVTFMFKKYKILRFLAPRTVPVQKASSPSAPQPSLTPPTPSSIILTLLPQPHISSPLAISPPTPQPGTQPTPSALQGARPDPQHPPPPDPPRAPGEEGVPLPGQCEVPASQSSAGQYFTTLHTSLCDVISCSVAKSSPELLQEWVKKAELVEELGEMPKSPPKTKNGSRIPEPQKITKGKEIWLAFQDVATLLTNLLSLLETFMFAHKCPFPHVVRAGAVFIPIHVVKEKLFPKLPGASVDQVLQEHKVELRPTTLSEERTLRDLELKSCTSRMLKLLALKQLPDIYPDLLNLFWYDSLRQQLGR